MKQSRNASISSGKNRSEGGRIATDSERAKRANKSGTDDSVSAQIRLMLLLASALDCQAFGTIVSLHRRTRVVDSCSELEYGLQRCCHLTPKLLMLDPKLDPQALARVARLMSSGKVEHLMVLDDHLRQGVLIHALRIPRTSYMTRQSGFPALLTAIHSVADGAQQVFDPQISERVVATQCGYRLMSRPGQPSLADLSNRQLEVLKCVAVGYTTRESAQRLKLAENTIGNHKAILRKKLGLQRNSELTNLAIREGLVSI